MTNGEKLDQVFPDGICPFSKNWLDYEYKEPTTKNDLSSGLENVSPIIDWNKCHTSEQLNSIATTKNDLGVDCISRADVLKLMQDNWHTHNGDWAMQESMDDIRALPSVTPQEPKIGYCKDCKYFEYDGVANVNGMPLIVAHEICSRWGNKCKSNKNGYCFLFEPRVNNVVESDSAVNSGDEE